MAILFVAILHLVLLAIPCSGADGRYYWTMITADCKARGMLGKVADVENEASSQASTGECADLRVAFADSTLIVGMVASRTTLNLTGVPVFLGRNSSVATTDRETDWFGFGERFTEVDHSMVLGPHCSYERESFALFVDMNVLYAVAECNFPNSPKGLGALTRSLIQSDGIVNTPAGPMVYFERKGLKNVAGVAGFSLQDAALIRYAFDTQADRLQCNSSELHKINETAGTVTDFPGLNAENNEAIFTYQTQPDHVNRTYVYRTSMGFEFVTDALERRCPKLGADSILLTTRRLVFAAMFSTDSNVQTFQEKSKLLAFTVGHKEEDWWAEDYKWRRGPPGSCPHSEVLSATTNTVDRENQLTTLLIIYFVIGFEVVMFAAIIGTILVMLIPYLKNKHFLPRRKRSA